MNDTDWLRLLLAPRQLSPPIRAALQDGQSATVAVEAARAWAARSEAGIPAETLQRFLAGPEPGQLSAHQRWLDGEGQGFIHCQDKRWPESLRELAGMPLALYWQGDLDLIRHPQLAVVGSRNPSPAGRRRARGFAGALAQRGLGICSGLAMGIDAAAHQGALDVDGITVAVCGRGLDDCYPTRNRALQASIAERGLLLSEYIPGTAPQRSHFPARNRIIAALSQGTLVVEATLNSGSLITAKQALNYGREVYAIPGSIDNPLARGCHQLLREGAHLVENIKDIVEPLGSKLLEFDLENPAPEPTGGCDDDSEPSTRRLLEALDEAPVSIDSLAARTGLPVADISSMLLILELQGAVALAPGGGYQRVK